MDQCCLDMENQLETNFYKREAKTIGRSKSNNMLRSYFRQKGILGIAFALSIVITVRYHMNHIDPTLLVYQQSMEAVFPTVERKPQKEVKREVSIIPQILSAPNSTTARDRKIPPVIDSPLKAVYGGPIVQGKLTALTTTDGAAQGLRLHRMFYFNSFANTERRAFMEGWMEKTGVPYQRIQPMAGNVSSCYGYPRCEKSLRVGGTYRHVLSADWVYDTSGAVLVMHNDRVSVDLEPLDQFLTNFTEKWNVLRLDCDTPSPDNPDAIWYPQPNLREDKQCVTANATLFRRGSLSKLKDRLGLYPDANKDVDCMLSKKMKTFCVNLGAAKKHKSPEPLKAVVRNSWILHPYGWSMDQIRTEAKRMPTKNPNKLPRIDRIYYSNLDKNLLRRQHMESWLSEQPIPYKRIPAQIGEPDGCIPSKNTPNRCRGMSGVAKTLTGIIDNENTTGVSLVLEDDVIPLDEDRWGRMMEAIKYVPDDWDIIRFDCWGIHNYGVKPINSFVMDTRKPKKIKDCENDGVCEAFCGGAYAMLWRQSRVKRLKNMWSKTPVDDADCIIGKTKYVQSYCVNIGLWEHFYIDNELSDVSMLND